MISLKLENKKPEGGEQVELSDFLNGYTCVSLYSRYSLCSHSVRVAQKSVTCCTKNCCVNKKIFHADVNAGSQNYASHKKICCGNKNMWHTKDTNLD